MILPWPSPQRKPGAAANDLVEHYANNVFEAGQALSLSASFTDPNGDVERVEFYRNSRTPSNRLLTVPKTTNGQSLFTGELLLTNEHVSSRVQRIFAVAFDSADHSLSTADLLPPPSLDTPDNRIAPVAITVAGAQQRPLELCSGYGAVCLPGWPVLPGPDGTNAYIDAARYNGGGQGVGYFEIDSLITPAENPRSDDVEVRLCAPNASGGHQLGTDCSVTRMMKGEWLKYSFEVSPGGSHFPLLCLRGMPQAAVTQRGPGPESSMHLEFFREDGSILAQRELVPINTETTQPELAAAASAVRASSTTHCEHETLFLTSQPIGFPNGFKTTVRITAPYTWSDLATGLKLIDHFKLVKASDIVPLGLSLDSPTHGDQYAVGQSVTLLAKSIGAGSNAVVRFWWRKVNCAFPTGNCEIQMSTPPITEVPYQHALTGLDAGTYQVYGTITFNGGTAQSEIINIRVAAAPTNRAPQVTLTSPATGTPFVPASDLQLTVDAIDPEGTALQVEFLRDGSAFVPPLMGVLVSPGGVSYRATWANVPAGSYRITARATDSGGLSNNSSNGATIVVAPATNDGSLAPPPPPSFGAVPGADASSDRVGATIGEFRVTESGAANYRIPLFALPGTAGVSPKLALTYQGSQDEGYLGVGWGIEGLHEVSRCRQSAESGDPVTIRGTNSFDWVRPLGYARLQFPGGTAASERDEYCLDGQRLLKLASKPEVAHGAAGARYRLEIDDQSRIEVKDDPATSNVAGAEYFIVDRKDGTRLTFGGRLGNKTTGAGAATNARLPVNVGGIDHYETTGSSGQNLQAVMTWSLSRLEDSSGNTIDYFYDYGSGDASGEQYLTEIHYSGRASGALLPQSRMVFTYESVAADSVRESWVSGMKFKRSRRLARVEVYSAGTATPVRTYHLEYSESSTTKRARLASVQECGTNSVVCLPKTRFDWYAPTLGVQSASTATVAGDVFRNVNPSDPNSLRDVDAMKFGDVNGDGRTDLVFVKNHKICWSIASADGFSYTTSCPELHDLFRRSVSNTLVNADPYLVFHLMDFNGDGRDDLMAALRNAVEWTVHLSNGAGFADAGVPVGIRTAGIGEAQLADYNGDGLLDAMFGSAVGSGATTPPPCSGCTNWGVQLDAWAPPVDFNARSQQFEVRGVSNPGTLHIPLVASLVRSGTNGISCGAGLNYCYSQSGRVYDGPATASVKFVGVTQTAGAQSYLPLPFEGGIEAMDFDGDGVNDLRVKYVARVNDQTDARWLIFRNAGWMADEALPEQPNWRQLRMELLAEFPIGNGPGQIQTPPIDTQSANPPELRDYRFQTVDLNADGLADLVYRSQGQWYYRVNTGRIAAPVNGVFPLSFAPPVLIGTITPAEMSIQFVDYDGDARTDLVYGIDDEPASLRRYYLRRWVGTGFGAAEALPNVVSNSGQNSERSIFADLDGDARPEQVLVDFQGGSTGDDEVILRRAATTLVDGQARRYIPVDLIRSATNGLGATTVIEYTPMTVAAAYLPGFGTFAAELATSSTQPSGFGRRSPVFDLRTAQFVVREARSSAPAATFDDASVSQSAMSRVAYRYRGSRVQSGGRGPLGFQEVQSFDWQTRVQTSTTYRQSFPLIGTPEQTTTLALQCSAGAGANDSSLWSQDCASTACLVNPDGPACFRYPANAANDREWPSTGVVIGAGWQTYAFVARSAAGYAQAITPNADGLVEISLPSTPTPLMVFASESSADRYELSGALMGSNVSVVTELDAFGNLLRGSVSDLDSSGASVRNESSIHVFGSTDDDRAYGRLLKSTVTMTRPGKPSVMRSSAFRYRTSDRLLIAEIIEPNSGNATDRGLITAYDLDEFGNRLKTATCASHVVNGGSEAALDAAVSECLGTTAAQLTFEPSDGTHVRRVAGVTMNPNDRRFPSEEWGWFRGVSGPEQKATLTVLSRNVFGDVTEATAVGGLQTRAGYGTLGRKYFESANSGAWSSTLMRYCTGAVPAAQFWTNNAVPSVTTVACPPGAKYAVVSTGAGTPNRFSYHDVLGREILAAAQAYDAAQYVVTSTKYDVLGRAVRKSLPTLVSQANSTPTSARESRMGYDILGRPLRVLAPDAAETTTEYGVDAEGRSTATITAPPNASNLRATRTEVRNVLGEVVQVSDGPGLFVCYEYRSTGELAGTRKQAVSCGTVASDAIQTTMQYDDLGRKISMVDPDKGSWSYSYNAAGELIKEINARGGCTLTRYDARGRMTYREDFVDIDCSRSSEHKALWDFDIPSLGNGGLAPTPGAISVESSFHGGSATPTQSKRFGYDSIGRLVRVETTLEGRVYTNRSTFDEFGRPFQDLFASPEFPNETGVLYEYTDSFASGTGSDDPTRGEGYPFRLRDANGGRSGVIYRETRGMDAFGQVTSEVFGATGAPASTRQFDPLTGRLTSDFASSGQGPIQNWTFQWDQAGNLRSRDDGQVTEHYSYDSRNRLLAGRPSTNAPALWSVSYDAKGNIETKGATFSYDRAAQSCGGATPGPHAVTRTTTETSTTRYCYDGGGNQTHAVGAGMSRTVSYSMADQVTEVRAQDAGGSSATSFVYGAGRDRVVRRDYAGIQVTSAERVIHYVGGAEVVLKPVPGCTGVLDVSIQRMFAATQVTQARGFGAGCVAQPGTTKRELRFVDHLGSTSALTDPNGALIAGNAARQRFDAFGARVGVGTWVALSPSQLYGFDTATTRRGYTGHEHIDRANLIHMNGRVYDPRLGRFLQADPIVQDPYNPQDLNRYAYVRNNPLSATDPTGYMTRAAQNFALFFVRVAAIVATAGKAGPLVVATIAAVGGAIQTGTVRGALRAGFTAYVGARFTAGLGEGAGNLVANAGGNSAAVWAAQTLTAGVVHGVMSELEGGKFGHGFASAAASIGLSPMQQYAYSEYGLLGAMLIGGTASVIAGGKFANGAVTAAWAYVSRGGGRAGDSEGIGEPSPESIRDTHIWRNRDWLDSEVLSVGCERNECVLQASLSVSFSAPWSPQLVTMWMSQIEQAWNVSHYDFGRGLRYTSRVSLRLADAGAMGDLHFGFRPDLSETMGQTAITRTGSGLIGMYFSRQYTAPHEFGHSLGIRHVPNASFGMMSYSGSRRVTYLELSRLINGYNAPATGIPSR
jgi:RHS repeat-associated protein